MEKVEYYYGVKVNVDTLNFFNSDVKLYRIGDGEKKILLLPGFPNSGLFYLNHLKLIPEINATYITFDVPGWLGHSKASKEFVEFDDRWELLSSMVSKILEKYEINSFSVLAYSFGTNIVLKLLERFDIKKIFFVSSVFSKELNGDLKRVKLLKFLNKFKLQKLFKFAFLERFEYIILNSRGNLRLTKYEIDQILRLRQNVNDLSITNDILFMFNSDLKSNFSLIKSIPISLAYSNTEPKYFIRNSQFIESNFKLEKNIRLTGSHDAFMTKPDEKIVNEIYNWLRDF